MEEATSHSRSFGRCLGIPRLPDWKAWATPDRQTMDAALAEQFNQPGNTFPKRN